MFRNISVYDVDFETDKDVWEYSSNRRFHLKELIQDFYRLVSYDVVAERGSEEERYSKFKHYKWEGDSTLILNGLKEGQYKVHYYAYPQEITDETPLDFELALDPEVANILPLYIASELYEDDDTSTAYYFRQQYDEAKSRLMPNQGNVRGRAEFEDVWGWD